MAPLPFCLSLGAWLAREPPGVAAGPMRAVARRAVETGSAARGCQAARVTGRVTRTRTEGVELKR